MRPSLALYNTTEDIGALIDALFRIQGVRGPARPPLDSCVVACLALHKFPLRYFFVQWPR